MRGCQCAKDAVNAIRRGVDARSEWARGMRKPTGRARMGDDARRRDAPTTLMC